MPYAVTHVLFAIILAEFIRVYVIKKRFKRYYVLFAGIAGLIPDIDFVIFWILKPLNGISLDLVHRVYTHTFVVPAVLIAFAFLIRKWKLPLLLIAMGYSSHLVLDAMLAGYINPLYPFASLKFGLNPIKSEEMIAQIFSSIDAVLLVLWLVHEEIKHKISDYF